MLWKQVHCKYPRTSCYCFNINLSYRLCYSQNFCQSHAITENLFTPSESNIQPRCDIKCSSTLHITTSNIRSMLHHFCSPVKQQLIFISHFPPSFAVKQIKQLGKLLHWGFAFSCIQICSSKGTCSISGNKIKSPLTFIHPDIIHHHGCQNPAAARGAKQDYFCTR